MSERKKKQATYETNVVKACRERCADKLEIQRGRMAEVLSQLALLKEQYRLASNDDTKNSIIREGDKLDRKLLIMERDEKCFANSVDLLDQLLTLLESFFAKERFKYIVKKIPEKKLPKMINDASQIGKVNDLLISLLKDFNNEYQRLLHEMEEVQKAVDQEENTTKAFEDTHTKTSDRVEKLRAKWDEEIKNEAGTGDASKAKRNYN